MYLPAKHEEKDTAVLQRFIHETPLGVLTTAIPSDDQPLILSSHIPWILDVDASKPDDLGRLRGHLARANPQSKALISSLGSAAQTDGAPVSQEVLVLFTAAPHHYVTPKFYTETKPATGKVVPTWDYAAVQVYGRATVYADSSGAQTSEFLSKQIGDLSNHAETSVMGYTGEGGRPGPWSVDDAPERYIELMKKNIIGIEIEVTSMGGKFKMNQESRLGDRQGVIKGFGELGTDVGRSMSALVKERGDLKDAAQQS